MSPMPGDWAGHACRSFLGVQKGRAKDRMAYTQLYAALRKKVTEQVTGLDERVTREELLEFITVLEGLSLRLVKAHNFYTAIIPFKDDEDLEAGITADFRSTLALRRAICRGCRRIFENSSLLTTNSTLRFINKSSIHQNGISLVNISHVFWASQSFFFGSVVFETTISCSQGRYRERFT